MHVRVFRGVEVERLEHIRASFGPEVNGQTGSCDNCRNVGRVAGVSAATFRFVVASFRRKDKQDAPGQRRPSARYYHNVIHCTYSSTCSPRFLTSPQSSHCLDLNTVLNRLKR